VEVHVPTTTIVPDQPHLYAGGWSLVTADFNNDGRLDLAGGYGKEIKVWLGNGDGTFRRGSNATQNYFSSGGISYGDFNGDGNEDLVFQADFNGPPTQFQVNLGDGDGRFRFGSRFGHFTNGGFDSRIVVGDFNGDGKLDIATPQEPEVAVFLGNGDGTFQRRKNYPPRGAFDVVEGDFNGDGKLDLVLIRTIKANSWALDIVLGNGDGTFQKPRTITEFSTGGCDSGPGLLVSDFNSDGNLDIAFCDRTRIGVVLGNGDGTFQNPVFYSVLDKGSPFEFSFAAGDFNSDGNADLVASYPVSDTRYQFALFLGKGDGTFQQRRIVKLEADYFGEMGIVSGDFNSDGLLDFVLVLPSAAAVFTQK